jgi:succinyl-diaminopimelate desuccinylase
MIEIIDLTKELAQFKTMHSRPDEIQRCAAFIEQYLKALDVTYQRFDYHNTPAILVLPQHNGAPLLLMSHIDVVDAPDKLFRPVVQDGKLYGRGCFDDKYAVALSLVLLKNNLRQFRKQGRGQKELPFGILITSDEEIGGFNGAKKTLVGIQTDFCIVLDGGNIEKIVVKENGVARIKLIYRGNVNSGSESCQGENAVEKVMQDINTLETYFVKSSPESPYRAIVHNYIRTEKSPHGIPGFTEARLDIRYTGSDDLEKLFSIMQNELLSNIIVEDVEPLFPGGESQHLKLLLKISKKTRIGFEDGANDSRFLSALGIKGIVWGADGNRSQHTPNEHVDIESVYDLYALLCAFIKQCGSPERNR